MLENQLISLKNTAKFHVVSQEMRLPMYQHLDQEAVTAGVL